MRKILGVLVLILGIGSAVSAEPVYVGEKVTNDCWIETFVSYDTDFDWSTVENVEENATAEFYMFQEDFDTYFEVGVTYTFSVESLDGSMWGFITFQRLEDDVDGFTRGWKYYFYAYNN